MTTASQDNPQYPARPAGTNPLSSETNGCAQALLFGLMAAWTIGATMAAQIATWAAEQDSTMSPPMVNLRWLILLVYALALLLPAGAVWGFARALPIRRFFAGFTLAALFTLLMVPARLAGIARAQETGLLLILGMALFLVIMAAVQRGPRSGWRGFGAALLVGGLLGIPWAAWGALGSPVDIFLNLLTALLFGASAAALMALIFRRDAAPQTAASSILLEGFAAWLVLLILSTGAGANGNQWLIALTVPMLGWGLAGLYQRYMGQDGKIHDNRRALVLLIGLAGFWPMAFIDPDEMAAVLSLSSAGELGQWAALAAFAGLAVALLGSLVMALMRSPGRTSTGLSLAAAALTWLGLAGVYLLAGQPGFYGERLFVILKDQADVSDAAGIRDYNQRRAAVYTALVQKAQSSQSALRADLDRWGLANRPYYLVNAVEVQGGPLARLWLERRPEVDRVLDSPVLRPLPAPIPESEGMREAPSETPWNLTMIGADKAWRDLGATGKGIIIGQSDSGVEGDHPELADSYRGRDGQQDYNWYDPWNGSKSPVDIGGHGTHTLGTALGNHVGVAPDAEWIGCVNLARNLANPALYLECMQFMLAPFPQGGDPLRDGRPELGAQVLNNSWGCPTLEGCDPNALLPAVKALRSAGVFVVSSAGNDGDKGCGSVAEPLALYDQVYSVGAVDFDGALTSFSSMGPVRSDGSGRVKPDIVAPGDSILSSFPGNTYSVLPGTSMAGPHVVGVVALMWSANPDLIGDIDRTEQILNETATPFQGPLPACAAPGTPNNAVGYGIINAYEAVRMATGR